MSLSERFWLAVAIVVAVALNCYAEYKIERIVNHGVKSLTVGEWITGVVALVAGGILTWFIGRELWYNFFKYDGWLEQFNNWLDSHDEETK